MSYRPDLGRLNAAYRNASPYDAYQSIPDGIYKAQIKSTTVDLNQRTGNMFLAWELDVALSQTDVVTIRKMNSLTDKAFGMLKRDLKAIGIDPDDIEPLDRLYDYLDYLVGAVVEFEQTTRASKDDPERKYTNQTFMRLIRESGKTLADYVPRENRNDDMDISDNDDELPF